MKHFVALIALSLLSACGPKAQLKPEFEKLNIGAVALLPIIDKTELAQDQINNAFLGLSQELRNAGYLVLDDNVTQRICPSAPCADQKKLFDDYLVDAVVQVTIDSSTQANVLAGYYNDISGTLVMTDKSGEQIAQVTGTEREKGGLLFNTGQILQGLIQQVRNEGSNKLLNSFFRKLVNQVPKPSATAAASLDSTTIAIKSINTRITGADVREICVNATPHSLVSLVFGSIKSNLQEISPGKYCREYFLNASFGTTAPEIEVRSPFGNSIRSSVMLADAAYCDFSQGISRADAKTITFSCPVESEKKPFRYIIYRQDDQIPQFAKVGEASGMRWVDSLATKDSDAQYVVIAKTERGDRSLPIFLEPAKN